MKNFYYWILSLLFISICALSFASNKAQNFVDFMLPKIKIANQNIIMTRDKILHLEALQQQASLTTPEKKWLMKTLEYYRIEDIDLNNNKTWHKLLSRVDSWPNSLVLAQAINESAWGTSYFALEANNYFGKWCTRPGCGVVPRRRAKGATHEIRKYLTAQASVNDYMHNLNVFPSYRDLRALREKQIQNHLFDSIALARGLKPYSQLGKKYVKIIRSIITNYDLTKYD